MMSQAVVNTSSTRRTVSLAAALLSCVAAVQLWVLTAGFIGWPGYTNYYAQLTDSFLHGQLSLRTLPPPKLLALPDPYDPVANGPYRLHDAILFDGKYYLYWGPAPALIAALVCAVFRIDHPDFGDQYLVAIFAFGTVLAAAILMLQIRARFFPEREISAIAVPILSLGLGTPILFTLARAAVYEAAICAGQFFLLAGFCAAFAGLNSHRRASWMTLAGALWALCIASRVSLLPGVAAGAGVILWQMIRRRNGSMRAGFGLAAPILAALALLGWYNEARFHRATEFGIRWQLAASNQHAKPMSGYMSFNNVPANVVCYLFLRPHWMGRFPFIRAPEGRPAVADWMNLPPEFICEAEIGIVWSQPFLLFAVAAMRRKSGANWLMLSLFAAGAFGFLPALMVKGPTMRYLLDAVPCFTILAAIGYWRLLGTQRGRAVRRIAIVLVVCQSLLALPLAVSGYSDHFMLHNPALYHEMKSLFGS